MTAISAMDGQARRVTGRTRSSRMRSLGGNAKTRRTSMPHLFDVAVRDRIKFVHALLYVAPPVRTPVPHFQVFHANCGRTALADTVVSSCGQGCCLELD